MNDSFFPELLSYLSQLEKQLEAKPSSLESNPLMKAIGVIETTRYLQTLLLALAKKSEKKPSLFTSDQNK